MAPIFRVVSNGACPGRTPRYPSLPGRTISSTASLTTPRSGVTMSSWILSDSIRSAPRVTLQLSVPHMREKPSHAVPHPAPPSPFQHGSWNGLGGRLHLVGLLLGLFDGTDQIESLLGDLIVLAGQDLLEAPDRLGDRDIFHRNDGEMLRE